MNVTVESTGALERRMRVELPIEPIQQQVDSRLKAVGRTAKIKGFRPGKVPPKVVKQRYGKQVREEVLGEVLQKSYSEAVVQQKLTPAAGPKIETEDEDGKTFAYVATFEVMPEVELKNLDKIKVEKPDVQIGDEDIDDMIAKLRAQKATWSSVDRKSKDGDQVIVDFNGELDGEAFPGGQGSEIAVILGEGQMLPDFEKGLKGIKAGDEKTFKVRFPKDYHAEDLAGKKADFSIKTHRVEEQALPELNDEFAEMFNVTEGGLDRLLQDVRENMEREAAQKVKNDIREQVLDALLANNPIDIPKSLQNQEAHSLQHEAMQRMGIEDHAMAPPIETFSEAAEKRVRLGLLLRRVIADNDLKADEALIRGRVEEMCDSYENSAEMVEMYMSNPQVLQQVEPMVVEQLAVDWLLANGKVKDKKISFKDYMNAPAS
ncbi:MAG: trigger factor [Gammaproteobacteria bacterium]|nr:trigger factor [Gammaproteobacteria bacterium]MBT8111485.1 trigger factor [Gammaproteobacteria bacterium]NND46870.1 trigger factor [Woeseiaceae bacterium]NNL46183.1 trigger factor [Woeseiaceae bacterium]